MMSSTYDEETMPAGGRRTYVPLDIEGGGVPATTIAGAPDNDNSNNNNTVAKRRMIMQYALIALIIAGFLLLVFISTLLSYRIQDSGQNHAFSSEEIEESFLNGFSAEKARQHLYDLTREPHIAGSEGGHRVAMHVRDKFKQYLLGLDAPLANQRREGSEVYASAMGEISVEMLRYDILMSYPLLRQVQLLQMQKSGNESHYNVAFDAPLREEPIPEDATSAHPNAIPTYNGYSPSGDVTGELVYANYGNKEDFDYLLQKLGIDIAGKIVIVRYGKNFRGGKVMMAEERGAKGVLIYSDPADDGFAKGKEYPEGPWRRSTAVQRGSVAYLSKGAGDPTTPGFASVPSLDTESQRLRQNESKWLPRIPVQPISWADAIPFLQSIAANNSDSKLIAPPEWQGALNFTYYVYNRNNRNNQVVEEPPQVVVHLKLEMNFTIVPIYNVIATIRGAVEPDRAVILGNHHDAWVFGGVDPLSGTAAMMEVVRSYGELLKKGWRPRRTIIVGSWDAEEVALVGSTEWVEENLYWLDREAVAYINVDMTLGVDFRAAASPSLAQFIRETSKSVAAPVGNFSSIFEMWSSTQKQQQQQQQDNDNVESAKAGGGMKPKVHMLGSGSDYTPFLQHAGIAAADLRFTGDYGVYHSVFDSFDWVDHIDQNNVADEPYGSYKSIAQVLGLTTLRLAETQVLPFDFTEYAQALQSDFESKIVGELAHAAQANNMSNTNASLPPVPAAIMRVRDALARFERAATWVKTQVDAMTEELAVARRQARIDNVEEDPVLLQLQLKLRMLNDRLMYAERGFLDRERGLDDGLGREWYKHLLVAPGYFLGYGAELFPTLAYAVQVNDMKLFVEQTGSVVRALEQVCNILERAGNEAG